MPSVEGCGADALLTSTSTPPKVAAAKPINSRACASSPTSARRHAARPPADATSAAVSRAPASLMSETTTAAASRAKRRAMARPHPVPPDPVTTTTRARACTALLDAFLEERHERRVRLVRRFHVRHVAEAGKQEQPAVAVRNRLADV